MQWGEWHKSRNQSQSERNKAHLHWLFYLTRRRMKATVTWQNEAARSPHSHRMSSLKFINISACVFRGGIYTYYLISIRPPGRWAWNMCCRWITCSSWGWTWDQRLAVEVWEQGSPGLWVSVGMAPCSVQLTYFKNRSIKRISKFPLWTYLELKIPWGHSGRKSQNEAKVLDFTWFISCRRAQLLPENNIFFSMYCLHFYLSGRSNRTLTTQKIQ